MRENQFNHGRLCEMLRLATDEELIGVINDVEKIRKEREDRRKEFLTVSIKNTLKAAIEAGYTITISTQDDLNNPDCVIHANNSFLTTIVLEKDKEEDY